MGVREWLGSRAGAVAARGRSAVPEGLELARGERVMATAASEEGVVVITTQRLVAPGLPEGGKPWHLVDAGGWDARSHLRATWVDGTPETRWRIEAPGSVPDAFHDRVQTSVVLMEKVSLDRGRRARVALRRDVSNGEIIAQTVVGAGCDPDDPELVAATEAAAISLAEKVGLEP